MRTMKIGLVAAEVSKSEREKEKAHTLAEGEGRGGEGAQGEERGERREPLLVLALSTPQGIPISQHLSH